MICYVIFYDTFALQRFDRRILVDGSVHPSRDDLVKVFEKQRFNLKKKEKRKKI